MITFFRSLAFLFLTLFLCSSYSVAQDLFSELVINEEKQNNFQYAHWFDDNNDGLFDLIFERDSVIYLNNGDNTFSPSNRKVPETGYVWQMTDLDKNGTIDFLNSIGISDVYALLNLENGSFQIKSLPIDLGDSYYPWVDIDGDGDLDYLFSSGYKPREPFSNKLWAYINEDGQYSRVENFNYQIYFKSNDRVYISDIDRDGDFDVLVSNSDQEGPVRVYSCQEPYKFQLDTVFNLPEGYNGKIYIVDINNDGYDDFMHTNAYGTQIFTNTKGKFSLNPQVFNFVWANYADWGDFDNDGYLDFIYSQCSGGKSIVSLYKNKHDGTFEEIPFLNKNYESIKAKWIDIDNDGYLDLSVENYKCRYWESYCTQPYHIQFFMNNGGNQQNQYPTPPSNLSVNIKSECIEWDAPAGDETPGDAMQYNLHLYMGTNQIVFPQSNLQTGSPLLIQNGNIRSNNFYDIRNLKPGSYSARVQSVDGGKRNSPFTSTISFEIKEPPGNLVLDNLQQGEISFSWENTTVFEELIIERAYGDGPFEVLETIAGNNQSFTDINPSFDFRYVSYRLKGKSFSSLSAYSNVLIVDNQKFSPVFFDFETEFWNADEIICGDYDVDGDIDLVSHYNHEISIFRNDLKSKFTQVELLNSPNQLFPTLDWCDINNDNLPDISTHTFNEGRYVFINQQSSGFQLVNEESPLPHMSKFVDIDLDGSNEIIFMDGKYFSFSEIGESNPVILYDFGDEIEERYRFFTYDFNLDMIPDIFILSSNSRYLQSKGNLDYEEIPLPQKFLEIEEHFNLKSSVETDMNSDGILDISFTYTTRSDLIEHVGYLSLSGAGLFDYTEISERPLYNASLFTGDIDNNGQSDLVIQAGYDNDSQTDISPVLYLNRDGVFEYEQLLENFEVSDQLEIADLDQDGDLDILCNGIDEETWTFKGLLFENKAADWYATANQPPSPPENLALQFDSSSLILHWQEGSDLLTNSDVLTYNYYLKKENLFLQSPLSSLENGKRFIQKPGNLGASRKMMFAGLTAGNYAFSVQSVDNGFLSSEFSSEIQFAIAPPPVLKEIIQLNSTGICISWEGISNAKGFVIKRSLKKYGPYQIIATLSGSETLLYDRNLERNARYFYEINYYGDNLLSEKLHLEHFNSDFVTAPIDLSIPDTDLHVIPCDVDSDGDFDLALTFNNRVVIYQNAGSNQFEKFTEYSLNFSNPLDIITTDLNNDNKVDFVSRSVNQDGVTIAIQNDDGSFNTFDHSILMPFHPKRLISADFNNDGRRDLLYNHLLFWMEDDEIVFKQFLKNDNIIDDNYSLFETIDLDHDLDMDVIYGGRLNWIKNTYPIWGDGNTLCARCNPNRSSIEDFDGNGTWDFAILGTEDYLMEDGMLLLDIGNFNFWEMNVPDTRYKDVRTTVGDYDNNGLPDLVASGFKEFPYLEAGSFAYLNMGNSPLEEIDIVNLNKEISNLNFVDIDNDNDLDLIVHSIEIPGVKIFLNTTIHIENGPDNTRPETPEDLKTLVYPDSVVLSWKSASDLETSDESLSYNIQVMDEEGNFVVAPLSNNNGPFVISRHGNVGMNKSWKLFGLSPGKYQWNVQSIDGGLRYSPFSTQGSFTILEEVFTGIDDFASSFNVYPNPATSFLNIELNAPYSQLCITNMLGHIIFIEEKSKTESCLYKKKIDLSHVVNGIYILTIEFDNHKKSMKIIKN